MITACTTMRGFGRPEKSDSRSPSAEDGTRMMSTNALTIILGLRIGHRRMFLLTKGDWANSAEGRHISEFGFAQRVPDQMEKI